MHSAPAVQYPVGRSHIRAAVLLLPWGLGGAAALLWGLQAPGLTGLHGLVFLLWLGCGLLVIRDLRQAPHGMLHWDGQQWRWQGPEGEQVGVVCLRLDLQNWLLLEFRAPGGAGWWLWPRREALPQRWGDLRRALVHARAGAAGMKAHP